MSLDGLMIVMIMAGMIFLALRGSRALDRDQQPQQLDAGPARYGETPLGSTVHASLGADITCFDDELRNLGLDVVSLELNEEAQANYPGALDAYENAKQTMSQVHYGFDATVIAHILREGRYATARVKSRARGRLVPKRRSPCFFDPARGPPTRNIIWVPPDGASRGVPAYTLDAARVTSGTSPHIRMVQQGYQVVPY